MNSLVRGLFYAGIGSRSTPIDVLYQMRVQAVGLSKKGFTLRSGAAEGADTAFENGANDVGGKKDIYIPWAKFGNSPSAIVPSLTDAFEIAKDFHPAWGNLSQGAKRLHARNCYQVLGDSLKDPADFVLCWTEDGCISHKTRTKDTGGTGMAISIAEHYGVPVINMKNLYWEELLEEWVGRAFQNKERVLFNEFDFVETSSEGLIGVDFDGRAADPKAMSRAERFRMS